jgi:hypothetical protein
MQTITPEAVAQFAGNYYSSVRNAKWLNDEHTLIACEVNFSHVGFEEWTPFCVDPNDYMPYSKQIFDECVAGRWGQVAEYVSLPVEELVEEPVVPAPDQPLASGVQTL